MKALLVDDDNSFGEQCSRYLIARNWEVKYCPNAEQGRQALVEQDFDIAIIDLMLPPSFSSEGLDLLRFIRNERPEVESVMVTTRDSGMTEIAAEAMKAGSNYFLDKSSPVFYDKLNLEIDDILRRRSRRIFISHGQNELLKLKLKDFIVSRLSEKPVVLSEQPSRGLTVVEKLERVSADCRFAVILMTRDDEQKDGGMRARQNVVHEIGFFQGRYGRKRVVLLAEIGVELFSNISGIVRIDFDRDRFEEIFESIRIEVEAAFREPVKL
jgi:DNA-binding response OmpR family regulator